jgi:hypothetical protein
VDAFTNAWGDLNDAATRIAKDDILALFKGKRTSQGLTLVDMMESGVYTETDPSSIKTIAEGVKKNVRARAINALW